MQNMSEEAKKLRTEYLKNFDPQKLNEQFYTVVLKQYEDSLLFAFEATKEQYEAHCKPGEKLRLLDFGCASNPMHVAASVASGASLQIVLSDFLPQNREHIKTWINGEEFQNFDSQFDLISKFSGKSSEEIKKRTRKSITKVESYDLFQDLSGDYGMYNVILCSYTIECASTSQEEYEGHMRKLVNLLAKGGTLVMTGSLGGKTYSNGEGFFEVFPLTEDLLRKLIPTLGLQLLRMKTNEREKHIYRTSEHEKTFVFAARKLA